MSKCDYGCGQKASHTFNNGKKCCSNNVKKCPSKKIHPTAKKIVTSKNCDYGCGKTALYEFKNGKICCSKKASGCPVEAEHNRKQMYRIDASTGKTIAKLAGGKSGRAANVVLPSGLTVAQERALRGRDTRLNSIDENGLNGYERNRTRTYKYKNTNLVYNSGWEKRYLEKKEQECGSLKKLTKLLSNASNLRINYISPKDNRQRRYLPDFFIKQSNTVVEIKSNFSWFTWNGQDQEKTNVAKLNATLDKGYHTVLVYDDIEMVWPVSPLPINYFKNSK